MAQNPTITTSPDGKLIQFIGEIDAKNASIVHHLKLSVGEVARFADLNIYEKAVNEAVFISKCDDYGIVTPKSEILLEFIYDIHADHSVLYREVKPFPEGGGYYTVPNKPKAVAVATVNQSGGGVVSRTGGEAL